jgi:hypothetical protein
VAQELPDVFLRVQFRAFGRRRDQRDIGPDDQGAGEMPSGLIDQKRHVRTRHDLRRDLGEVEIHRPSVAPRHDERCLCRLGRDRAEEAVRRSLGPKDAFPPLVKDKSNEDVEVFALRAEFEHLTAASLEQQS